MSTLKNQVIKLEETASDKLTVLWHEIEHWQQDNHYITSGYRKASNSYIKSLQSLGFVHNETVNVYTHLLGAIVAAITGVSLYHVLSARYQSASDEDVKVFACFFIGAVACLGMSATFHLISNHSPRVAKFGNQLDYLGIVCLIWGSFIPSIYYGFTDYPDLVHRYWIMITTIGVATAASTLMPVFRTSAFRPVRTTMFVLMGLSAVFPVLHGLKLYSYEDLKLKIGLNWLVLQGVLYISGAFIYAARVPERFAPGRFDLLGSSHQIFHVLILLAAASHLKGLLVAFDHWHY